MSERARRVIKGGLATAGQNHDGGSIGFGWDGKLYFAIGDNGNGTGVNADLSSSAAKVSRMNRDGTAPNDNPFFDGAGPNNDYIWARGVRNPFTMTFNSGNGQLWLNVVGTSYEQVFVINKGDHAGYNLYENNQPAGYITPRIVYRTNGSDTRSIASSGAVRNNNVVTFTTTAAHGFRRGGKITIAGVTSASFNGSFYVNSVPSTTTFTVAQTGPNETSGGGTATTAKHRRLRDRRLLLRQHGLSRNPSGELLLRRLQLGPRHAGNARWQLQRHQRGRVRFGCDSMCGYRRRPGRRALLRRRQRQHGLSPRLQRRRPELDRQSDRLEHGRGWQRGLHRPARGAARGERGRVGGADGGRCGR